MHVWRIARSNVITSWRHALATGKCYSHSVKYQHSMKHHHQKRSSNRNENQVLCDAGRKQVVHHHANEASQKAKAHTMDVPSMKAWSLTGVGKMSLRSLFSHYLSAWRGVLLLSCRSEITSTCSVVYSNSFFAYIILN